MTRYSILILSLQVVGEMMFLSSCGNTPTPTAPAPVTVYWSATPTFTFTPCLNASLTPCTATNTFTPTHTFTFTSTSTPTNTLTDTYTVTQTSTATNTSTPCGYPGNTCTYTFTPLVTSTSTSTSTPTSTFTIVSSPTPTSTSGPADYSGNWAGSMSCVSSGVTNSWDATVTQIGPTFVMILIQGSCVYSMTGNMSGGSFSVSDTAGSGMTLSGSFNANAVSAVYGHSFDSGSTSCDDCANGVFQGGKDIGSTNTPVWTPTLTPITTNTFTFTRTATPTITFTRTPTPSSGSFVVNFPDHNLEILIRSVLNKPSGVILNTDLLTIQELNAEAAGISNIEGLQYCKNLLALALGYNHSPAINDFYPLTLLTQLTSLTLDYDQLSDISFLTSLTNLQYLDLAVNQIQDLTPLSGLTQLYFLNLGSALSSSPPATGFSALSNLSGLQDLDMDFDHLTDITFLAGLTNIWNLSLDYNSISDISPLSNLNSVSIWLYLDNNQISTIPALPNLGQITKLGLSNNLLSDISVLSNCHSLNVLYLDGNSISDISALTTLPLDVILLEKNFITDVQALVDNPHIGINNGGAANESIDLTQNPLSSYALSVEIPNLQSKLAWPTDLSY